MQLEAGFRDCTFYVYPSGGVRGLDRLGLRYDQAPERKEARGTILLQLLRPGVGYPTHSRPFPRA